MRKKRTNPAKKVPKPAPTTSPAKVGSSVVVGKLDRSGGTLVPQPHGGALSAGNPGNKGGGRTPDELRALFRQPLAKLLPVVQRIAEAIDTQEVTCPHCDHKLNVTSWLKAGDKLKAVDLLARYGIGTHQVVESKGEFILIPDTRSLSG